MERGHNDDKQHKHNVLRFTRKNRMSVFLEPNTIRGIYMVVMYTRLELIKDMSTSVYIQVIYRVG